MFWDLGKVNFGKREIVLETARTFADLAAGAYNSAGKLLIEPAHPVLAGKIVSTEARHELTAREKALEVEVMMNIAVVDAGVAAFEVRVRSQVANFLYCNSTT